MIQRQRQSRDGNTGHAHIYTTVQHFTKKTAVASLFCFVLWFCWVFLSKQKQLPMLSNNQRNVVKGQHFMLCISFYLAWTMTMHRVIGTVLCNKVFTSKSKVIVLMVRTGTIPITPVYLCVKAVVFFPEITNLQGKIVHV